MSTPAHIVPEKESIISDLTPELIAVLFIAPIYTNIQTQDTVGSNDKKVMKQKQETMGQSCVAETASDSADK
jgi:hypothetical protein